MVEKGKEPLLPPELEDVDSISYAWFRVRKRVLFGAKNFKKIYAHYLSAQSELNEATDYYEECRPGLGLEFAKEVYSAIQLITQFPEAWPPLSENTRRCL
jgi:hypothetical protein